MLNHAVEIGKTIEKAHVYSSLNDGFSSFKMQPYKQDGWRPQYKRH
ncbi:hypothetical protein VCR17J2_20232 [Vibrio coralliirubri]|nr:hypothetical protein VCR17J2_20232 [Vibrio coralliirubri]